MHKRLFAGLLSAALFLVSCGTVIPPEESDEDRYETEDGSGSDPQVSEGNPEVGLPEERETELELVTTFKTGVDGLFPYFFYWAESGPEHAAFWTTKAACADDKGNVYVAPVPSGHEWYIYRLNDGKVYDCGGIDSPISMLYSDGLLYLLLEDSHVVTIHTESGKRTLMTPFNYLKEHPHEFLFVSSDGEEPIWLRYDGKERYSLHGEKLSAEGYPRTVIKENLPSGKATLAGRDTELTVSLDGGAAGCDWSVKYEDAERLLCAAYRSKYHFSDEPDKVVVENIYCVYDQSGNVLANCKQTAVRHTEQPCSLPFTQNGIDYTLEGYHPRTVTIGTFTFEGVFDHSMVYGSDGTMYLLLYDLDHGEVYRILPGYENATFSELTK